MFESKHTITVNSTEQRQQRILTLLATAGYETVPALAKALEVSEMTIRRDFDLLESRGLIRRYHGGAVGSAANATNMPVFSIDFEVRRGQQAVAKTRIAQAACSHLQDGQVVFLDAGTTVLAMAEFLVKRSGLTVITPSLPLASALASNPGLSVILLGGGLRADLLSTVGPLAEQTLENFAIDVAVFGAAGIDLQRGLSHALSEEIPLKRRAAELAARVIVLATREKFGRGGAMYFLPASSIDLVLRDSDTGIEELVPDQSARSVRTVGTNGGAPAPIRPG